MKISTQNVCLTSQYGIEKGFRMLSEAGFEGVDWSLEKTFDRTAVSQGVKTLPYSVFTESMDKIKAVFDPELAEMKKNGLVPVQSHAVFPAYVKDYPEYTDYCIEIYKNTLRYCAYAEVPCTVIHGVSRRQDDDSLTDEQFRKLNMKLYSALIPAAKETGVTVLLENLFTSYDRKYILSGTCSDPHEANEYIDTLNAMAGRECFGLCLDTGHLNLVRKLPRPYIDIVGKRIKALHLNDNSTFNDDHRAPYSGNVKWDEVCDGLRAVGYDHDINFETYRQVYTNVPERVQMQFLRAIYECGAHFRERIQG